MPRPGSPSLAWTLLLALLIGAGWMLSREADGGAEPGRFQAERPAPPAPVPSRPSPGSTGAAEVPDRRAIVEADDQPQAQGDHNETENTLHLFARWESGEPAVGFRVCPGPPHPGQPWSTLGTTDASGQLVAEDTDPRTALWLIRDLEAISHSAGPGKSGQLSREVVLPEHLRPRRLQSRVVDDLGGPVVDMRVLVNSPRGQPVRLRQDGPIPRTDAGGFFQIDAISGSARLRLPGNDRTFPEEYLAQDLFLDDAVLQRRHSLILRGDSSTPFQGWIEARDEAGNKLPWMGNKVWSGAAILKKGATTVQVPANARRLLFRYSQDDAPQEFDLPQMSGSPFELMLQP